MKAKLVTFSLMLASCVFLISVPAFAHHGTFVSYDVKHPITLTGVVSEFRFTNPHSQLFFDVTDDSGKVTRWAVELAPPEIWVAGGWGRRRTEAALAPGTKIKVTLAPARNGKPVGAGSKIFLDNGDQVGPHGNGDPNEQ